MTTKQAGVWPQFCWSRWPILGFRLIVGAQQWTASQYLRRQAILAVLLFQKYAAERRCNASVVMRYLKGKGYPDPDGEVV